MSEKITSLTNPRVKQIVRLKDSAARKESGLIVVDGLREITRELEAKIDLKEIYTCHELLKGEGRMLWKKLSALKKPLYETTKEVFEKISYGERQDGILIVCEARASFLSDVPTTKQPLIVVVEHVEKPGNLGAIIRTADSAGVDGVIVCDAKTDIYNPNVIRASMGTVFSIKIVVSSNEAAYKFLKSKEVTICTARPQAKMIYTEGNFRRPVAIVVGSEEKGLSDFWIGHSDTDLKIPMHGRADSLNVSTSTAILLYEALRQRSQ